ncbi:putative membrane domain protein [Anaplasma phagocytophilum str. ApMUC09]|nr:putative membrane domain protein [Anaplasma phagocytophilum str. ApMUC09]
MAPSIHMSEGVQTSLRLMISFGWILAIAGAMIVAYASSKSVQHSNPDINASLSPSSNRDASVGLCVEDCIPTFQNNSISVAH